MAYHRFDWTRPLLPSKCQAQDLLIEMDRKQEEMKRLQLKQAEEHRKRVEALQNDFRSYLEEFYPQASNLQPLRPPDPPNLNQSDLILAKPETVSEKESDETEASNGLATHVLDYFDDSLIETDSSFQEIESGGAKELIAISSNEESAEDNEEVSVVESICAKQLVETKAPVLEVAPIQNQEDEDSVNAYSMVEPFSSVSLLLQPFRFERVDSSLVRKLMISLIINKADLFGDVEMSHNSYVVMKLGCAYQVFDIKSHQEELLSNNRKKHKRSKSWRFRFKGMLEPRPYRVLHQIEASPYPHNLTEVISTDMIRNEESNPEKESRPEVSQQIESFPYCQEMLLQFLLAKTWRFKFKEKSESLLSYDGEEKVMDKTFGRPMVHQNQETRRLFTYWLVCMTVSATVFFDDVHLRLLNFGIISVNDIEKKKLRKIYVDNKKKKNRYLWIVELPWVLDSDKLYLLHIEVKKDALMSMLLKGMRYGLEWLVVFLKRLKVCRLLLECLYAHALQISGYSVHDFPKYNGVFQPSGKEIRFSSVYYDGTVQVISRSSIILQGTRRRVSYGICFISTSYKMPSSNLQAVKESKTARIREHVERDINDHEGREKLQVNPAVFFLAFCKKQVTDGEGTKLKDIETGAKKGKNIFLGDDTVILAFTMETRVAGEFSFFNSGIFKNPRLLYEKENSVFVGFRDAQDLLAFFEHNKVMPYLHKTHNKNHLELSLCRAFESLETKLRPPFSLEIPDPQEYVELNRAIVYGVLCDPISSKTHIKHLHALVTDGYAFFTSLLVGIVVELYGKLVDSAKIQLLWVTNEMIVVSSVGLEDLLVSLLRRIGSGDYGDENVWLCSELVNLFLDNWDCLLEDVPLVLTSALYSFLRLLADHCRVSGIAKLENAKRLEIKFCVKMFREQLHLSLKVGRDLVWLLQDLVHVSEFGDIWKDLISKQCSEMYKLKTSSRYFLLRITPQMETQLRFLLGNVKLGSQKRHQIWFLKKFLLGAEKKHFWWT